MRWPSTSPDSDSIHYAKQSLTIVVSGCLLLLYAIAKPKGQVSFLFLQDTKLFLESILLHRTAHSEKILAYEYFPKDGQSGEGGGAGRLDLDPSERDRENANPYSNLAGKYSKSESECPLYGIQITLPQVVEPSQGLL